MDIQKLREEHYNATVLSVVRVHETLMKIRVLSDAGKLHYEPGQYTILALGDWEGRFDGPGSLSSEEVPGKLIKRAYSIASPLLDEQHQLICGADHEFLEFYITLVPRPDHEGPKRAPLTPRLFALKPGDRLHMGTHIVGAYTLAGVQPEDNILFAATGTGEAPHNSMTATLLKQGHRGKIASLVCTRYRQDAAYIPEQIVLNHRYPQYRYRLYTTREAENLDTSHPDYVGKQYLQDIIQPNRFEEEFGWRPDPQNTHVFLCGNPDMIGIPKKTKEGTLEFPEPLGLLQLLHEQGFPLDTHTKGANVHYEKYW